MNIGENEDGNNSNFYGFQAGYRINNKLGTGQYRAVVAGSSEDFLNVEGTQLVKRITTLLSFDQEFGKVIGGWLRLGWRNDDSASDYDAIYSGGIDIKGSNWGRSADNIGLGYAYINGGNLDIDKSNVAEAYYRWQMGKVIGLTADIQYMKDDYKIGQGPSGWIYSLRATAEF
jgi:porin